MSDTGLSSATYVTGKLMHGIISAVITLVISRFVPLEDSVASILAEEVRGLSELDFPYAAGVALASAAFVLLFFLGISRFSAKKAGKT